MNKKGTAVLVVDDDSDIRGLLRLVLEGAGHRVYEVANGKTALERLRTHRTPLVVLLDYELPGMNGLEVLRAVAADTSMAQRHAFILVTAYYDAPELSGNPFPPGMSVPIIRKPFGTSTLLHAVAEAAERLA